MSEQTPCRWAGANVRAGVCPRVNGEILLILAIHFYRRICELKFGIPPKTVDVAI